MSDPFVVKVQKSLVSSDGNRHLLIYDSSRSINYQQVLTKEMDEQIPSVKEYYWAILRDDGQIELQGEPIKHAGVRGETPEEQFDAFSFGVMNPKGKS